MIPVFARPQPPTYTTPGECVLCPKDRPPQNGTHAVAGTNKRCCRECADEFVSTYHLAPEVIA